MRLSNINSLNTNNGNYNSYDCRKPKNVQNFSGFESENENPKVREKVRYKHYEELDDEVLALKSMVKAHRDVQQSDKMRLYKAIPAITTGIIGTIIAITQPGKLSAKAAAGLGFLALVKGASMVSDFAVDKFENSKKVQEGEIGTAEYIARRTGVAVGTTIASAAGAFALIKAGPKALEKVAKPAYDFIKKDSAKLADTMNSSKAGAFVEKTLNPFIEKHPKANAALGIVAPILTIIAGIKLGDKLVNDMSKDIKEKASDNFFKSKVTQHIARAEFDKIDATEV